MRPQFKLLILAFLIFPIVTKAQFRSATCEVQPLWLIPGGVRSSNFGLMGTFVTNGQEDEVVRSFPLERTNLVATVGIRYEPYYSNNKLIPGDVRLAITVSDKEQKRIFESVGSSEAKTGYTKKWNLSVTKNIANDDRVYMFSFRCWDTASFAKKRPFL